MKFSSFVVPDKRDPDVFVEGSHEMTGVLFANVLDSEVVNYKGELDRTPLVFPRTRDEFALVVTVFDKEFFKLFLGQGASLWEALYQFPHLDVGTTIHNCFVA